MKKTNEGWDDMLAAAKAKRGPQPNGGSGVKSGSSYGGSKSKVDAPVPTKGPSVSQIRKLQDKIAKAKSKNEEVDEALVGNQHKLDKNKNGRLDKDDFKKIRGEEKDVVTMNPKMKQSKSANCTTEAMKSADKEAEEYTDSKGKIRYRMVSKEKDIKVEASCKSKIRESLEGVLENKQTAGAIAQPMQDDVTLSGAGAKKMKADHEPKLELDANKNPDENKKAELAGPNGKARPNDNNQGDKKIINPVADVTKKATSESFIDKISAIYKSMLK